jgi:arginase
MSDIRIVFNPSEIGAGTRGASLGLEALRIAGWNKKSSLLNELPPAIVETNNDILYEPDPNPNAHYLAQIREVYENTAEKVVPVIESGAFPLMIGADHSVAGGTIAALKKAWPESRIGVIWIDAHADLHTPYTSPSGNVHGMPLATVLGEDNTQVKANDPLPETVEEWNTIKQLWGISPKILHEDLIFYGVRDTESQEDALIARKGIRNFTVDEVRNHSISQAVNETVERLKNCDKVYISFDVDSMDPDVVSHGTGTPVPNGFTPQESVTLIKLLFEKLPVCCFEMVEINPTLDEKRNTMGETAFDILEQVVTFIRQSKKG